MALKIIIDNLADSATLAASPTMVASMPVGNLQVDDRSQRARSLSPSSQAITGNWPVSQTVSAVVLWDHSLVSGQWRVRLYSGANQSGSVVHDSALTALAPLYFDAVTARSFRIDLQATGSYADLGRLIIGAAWMPSEAPDYGASVRAIDPVELARTDAGSSFHPGGPAPYRELSFSLADLPESDRATLFGLLERVVAGGNCWVSLYAGAGDDLEDDHALWGRPVTVNGVDTLGFARYGGKLVFQEA